MITCLLAGTLAAAVPGELMLTEQIYGAEGASYSDEDPADEVTDADGIGDMYESSGVIQEEAEAPYTDAETDSFSMPESGGLSVPDDEEETPLEMETLFYEDYEHAQGGVVPVIWNTSDSVSVKNDLEIFTEEIVGADSLPSSYINNVRTEVRNQDGNSCWVHSLTASSEISMISAGLADERLLGRSSGKSHYGLCCHGQSYRSRR